MGKVWYAITGSTDGHDDVVAVGHDPQDLLEELKSKITGSTQRSLEENDQNYISIHYADLRFGAPE